MAKKNRGLDNEQLKVMIEDQFEKAEQARARNQKSAEDFHKRAQEQKENIMKKSMRNGRYS